jgi:hypothetical protein
MVALFILLLFFMKKNKLGSFYYLYPSLLVCIFLSSGISLQSIPVLQTRNVSLTIWKLSTALLILLFTNAVILWVSYQSNMKKLKSIDRRFLFSVLLCVAVPFISSFGSAHGILNMGSLFSGPLLLAIVLISFLIFDSKIKIFVITGNLAFAFFLTLAVSIQSYQHPWNIEPPAQSTEILTIGLHDTQIYVDKAFSTEVKKLKKELVHSGWTNSQPLLGVNWHIASTIPYVLGARPPNSLMLTIYGYDNSMAALNYNLSPRFDPYPYQTAWIMTTPLNQLTPAAKIEMQLTLDALETKTFREFPADYSFVTQSMGIEYWKPKS